MKKTSNKQLYFKDEGGYLAYKLTQDGKPADPHEMYEYGSLQTLSCANKKEAKEIAKALGCIATF